MFETDNKKIKVICILGMHRSGTSMLARILNIGGVYLGEPSNLSGRSESNAKGHWENKEVLRINEEILRRLGGSWDNPPKLVNGWEDNANLDDLRVRAVEFSKQMNAMSDVWCFKDPRTCITISFWKKVIPDMLYVIPVRSSLDVAWSLRKRDGISLLKGIYLWTIYWSSILNGVRDEKRIFSIYGNYFSDWRNELGRVMNFINDESVSYNGKEDLIREFISPELVHNRNNDIDIEDTHDANNAAMAMVMEDMGCGILAVDVDYEKRIQQLELEIINLRSDIDRRDVEINFMKSSKFWKLRGFYIKAKGPLKKIARKIFDQIKTMLPMPIRLRLGRIYNSLSAKDVESGQLLDILEVPEVLSKRRHLFDILNFSIIGWDFRMQRPQQLCREFAKKGNRIFYISPDIIHLRKSNLKYDDVSTKVRARQIDENIFEINLVAKNKLNVYRDVISDPDDIKYLFYSIKAVWKKFGFGDSISIVELPFWHRLAKKIGKNKIVYDCMDDHSGFENNSEEMIREEGLLLKEADLVVVSSKLLYEKARSENDNLIVVKNAGEVSKFSSLRKNELLRDVDGPIVGYYGAIAEWFDYDLVERCAQSRPSVNFVLIGHIVDSANKERLKRHRNIHLLGEMPYEAIADYLYHFDVCMIPFKIIPLTLATNPVKFFEYIASGKPVVSVDLPELREYKDIAYIAKSKEDFLRSIDNALSEQDEAVVEKRKLIAAENTWAHRAERMLDEFKRTLYPKIDVIIVTYNNLDYTKKCLESVLATTKYPNFEVIIVDNNSSDGTPQFLRGIEKENANIKVILNKENKGFAGGNNDGLRISSGDFVVLLNNDTIVTGTWLSDLKRILEKNSELGIIGPVSNSVGNIQRISVGYEDPDDMQKWARGFMRSKDYSYKELRMVGFFCVMISRKVLDKVGLLDENFGIGMFEDDDYCMRVKAAGFKVGYTDKVFIHHFGSVSFKKIDRGEFKESWDKNRLYFENKWKTKWEPVSN